MVEHYLSPNPPQWPYYPHVVVHSNYATLFFENEQKEELW